MGTTRRFEGDLRLRRGRRTDLAGLRRLVPARPDGRTERFDRRTLADLSHDVYVAEAPDGALVGVVAIGYVRSLQHGRYTAVLDTARVEPGTGRLLEALLDLAEERARRRGCRQVRACPAPGDDELRAALAVRGWRGDHILIGELAREADC
jgi:L-amino acid N-acyltransferase YncA